MDDRPRLLKDPQQIELRLAELSKPHIKPLADFATSLRMRGYGEVPDFDPWDGGTAAKALFLLEKPSAKAFASGFISRNNNDKTAENTFKFMMQVEIPRKQTCLWNIVPGWNGTKEITAAELSKGAEATSELLKLLSNVRVVVLVGKRAFRAWSRIDDHRSLPTIVSAHPSPINYARARETWDEIPGQWAKVKSFLQCEWS